MNINEYIDHTLLKANATNKEIINLCDEAKKMHFKSVCVNPSFISLAKKQLEKTNVKICSVISFPLGAMTKTTKMFEANDAIKEGADEIDMVANISHIKDHDYQYVEDEIKSIRKITKDKKIILKVIIETCLLTQEEISQVSLICKKIGVDFVKTSTGFSKYGATTTDVALIRKIVGKNIGVKASGGIHTYDEAMSMIKSGANRIGTSSGVTIINSKK
ncbi:MAG: deoxyribose-phosphate aldolase [Bacilli bacterium]|nr:deoxyribose-phosphate aldolase [Bacilli bacterium]